MDTSRLFWAGRERARSYKSTGSAGRRLTVLLTMGLFCCPLVKRYLGFPACADGDAGSLIALSSCGVGTGWERRLPRCPQRSGKLHLNSPSNSSLFETGTEIDNAQPRATAIHKHASCAALLSSPDAAQKATFGLSDLMAAVVLNALPATDHKCSVLKFG